MGKKINLEITDQELSRLEETVNAMIYKLQKDWCESEDVLVYKSLLSKLQSAFNPAEMAGQKVLPGSSSAY